MSVCVPKTTQAQDVRHFWTTVCQTRVIWEDAQATMHLEHSTALVRLLILVDGVRHIFAIHKIPAETVQLVSEVPQTLRANVFQATQDRTALSMSTNVLLHLVKTTARALME